MEKLKILHGPQKTVGLKLSNSIHQAPMVAYQHCRKYLQHAIPALKFSVDVTSRFFVPIQFCPTAAIGSLCLNVVCVIVLFVELSSTI